MKLTGAHTDRGTLLPGHTVDQDTQRRHTASRDTQTKRNTADQNTHAERYTVYLPGGTVCPGGQWPCVDYKNTDPVEG